MALKGKTAVVTGSTSGIGHGIAMALAKDGVNIVVYGLGTEKDNEKAIAEIKALGIRVAFDPANMLRHNQIADMIAKAERDFGSVDILVNNAGIQHVARVENFPPERWDAIIGINLSASFHTIRAALPLMKQKGWGRIINIASTHGLVASTHKVAYVAAKHGLIGLTKVVGIECADTGVTCNAICPGFVATPLALAQIETKAKADKISMDQASHLLIGEKQPQVQFTRVEQIAGLAVFLASETASNMQGAALVSDGGWTAQ